MSKVAKKVQKSLQGYLSIFHPTEDLRVSLMGMEGTSMFAEAALLGPIASAAGRRNYHIGLTNNRIVLIPLSFWNGKPSGRYNEIHLARVDKVEYKKGFFYSRLNIFYGQELKRSLMLSRLFKKTGEEFERVFSLTPPPTITEKEIEAAIQQEALDEHDKRDRINNMIVAFVLVVMFLILINAIF